MKKPRAQANETGANRYGLYLIVLFALLLIYPFLGYNRYLSWIFSLASLAVFASALRVSHDRGIVFISTMLLGFSFVVTDSLSRSFGVEAFHPFAAGLRVLFFGQMIVLIFRDIMQSKHVSMNTVLGASCIYVMIGLAFGSAYILLQWLVPGAFHIPELSQTADGNFGAQSTEFELVYFSLVTMTTIGYGDILPVASAARALATLEGLLSQLYLAIIIARMVGLEIASRLENPKPDQ